MTQPLATDAIMITHGPLAVRMVPTLRAATTLQRKHGLAKIINGLDQMHVSIILDLIDAATDNDPAGRKIVQQTLADHGVIGIAAHKHALEAFIAESFGLNSEPADNQRSTGKHISIEQNLSDLFEIATGWLGWSPAEAWAATPGEIVAAQRGLISKLEAIHGSGEQKDSTPHDPRAEVSREEVKAGLAALKAEARRGKR